jgi:hypothetical protein
MIEVGEFASLVFCKRLDRSEWHDSLKSLRARSEVQRIVHDPEGWHSHLLLSINDSLQEKKIASLSSRANESINRSRSARIADKHDGRSTKPELSLTFRWGSGKWWHSLFSLSVSDSPIAILSPWVTGGLRTSTNGPCFATDLKCAARPERIRNGS